MTLRHDVVLRMDYRASATSQLRLGANGSKASSKARLRGDIRRIHQESGIERPGDVRDR